MSSFQPSQYFSSAAKVKVLEAILNQEEGIPLRHVEYISGLNVTSVSRTLRKFQHQRIIRRKKEGNRILFLPNTDHPHFSYLRDMFLISNKAQLVERSKDYTKDAAEALEWANEAIESDRRRRERNR